MLHGGKTWFGPQLSAFPIPSVLGGGGAITCYVIMAVGRWTSVIDLEYACHPSSVQLYAAAQAALANPIFLTVYQSIRAMHSHQPAGPPYLRPRTTDSSSPVPMLVLSIYGIVDL